MGYIYKVTNLINQKIYIGKTVAPEQRWKVHVWEALHNENKSHSLLHKAIIKYSEGTFEIEILGEFPDAALFKKEKDYIKSHGSHYSLEKGYNLSWGGEGNTRYSDREILTLWEQGYNGTEIAEKLSAKTTTICLRLKALVGEKAAQERKKARNEKPVCQYDLDGNLIKIWESGVSTERALKLCQGSISRCCNQLRTSTGNYFWKFEEDENSIETLKENYANSNQCKKVDLIDQNGQVLKTFSSAKEAESELNLPRGKVSEVCNKKRNNTGGYKFQWNYSTKRRLVNERVK